MSNRVSIADIANALGLSRNTVSKALNGSAGITNETRQRVLDQAVRMNYKMMGSHVTRLQPTEPSTILLICKEDLESCDSMLAQGGICVLRDENDYDAFYEDTLKAGHYENNPDSVHIMIHSSREVISDLISFGVRFEKEDSGNRYFCLEL